MIIDKGLYIRKKSNNFIKKFGINNNNNLLCFKNYYRIISIILLIFLIISLKFTYNKKNQNQNQNQNQNNTDDQELMNAIDKSENFIKKSSRGKLFYKRSLKKVENPILTVVVPVYNCEKTIKRLVRSVQNQNIQKFQIVLVNDFSNNQSLSIIQELKKEDPRIEIINNKKNMGTLYSRCIGTLHAKGKYIFPIDNDDMFADKDVFEVVLDEAINNNFDIVKFRAFGGYGINSLYERKVKRKVYTNHKIGLTIYQPKLSYFPIVKNINYIHDVFLWCKCIKSDIYKAAINLYGEEQYSKYVIGWEDAIINYIICQIANSFKYIGKFGYFNIYTKDSSFGRTSNDMNNRFELIFLDAVVKFSKETFEGKAIILYIVSRIFSRYNIKTTLQDETQIQYFNSTLKKIMNNNYISDNDKKIMKDAYFSVLGKQFMNNTN